MTWWAILLIAWLPTGFAAAIALGKLFKHAARLDDAGPLILTRDMIIESGGSPGRPDAPSSNAGARDGTGVRSPFLRVVPNESLRK